MFSFGVFALLTLFELAKDFVSVSRITGVNALAWRVARSWPFAGLCLSAV